MTLPVAHNLALKLARAAVVLAIIAAWEAASRTGLVNPRLLPSASETLTFAM